MVLAVLVHPSVVNHLDRDRIEIVPLFSARPARDEEAGPFEDPQMLHDAEAGHRQLRFERGQCPAILLVEQV